ncbi:MAG: glycosyltransferase [bacterium]
MKPLRIAFIVSEFPVLSETFILNQMTGLLDMGHELTIFSERNSKASKVHEDINKYKLLERVYYSNMPSNKISRLLKALYLILINFYKAPSIILKSLNIYKYGKPASSLRLLYNMIPFLDKDFDIIHCHFGHNGIIGALLKDIGVQGKIVTSFYGYDLPTYAEKNNYKIYENLFHKGDIFIGICDHFKKSLVNLGCNEKKIIIHHLGVDIQKFQFSIRNIKTGEPTRILTIGRLVEKKGLEFVIRALAKILQHNKSIRYLIAGEGPLEKELKRISLQLNVDHAIEFYGAIEQKEVIKLYKQAHIFILPSITVHYGEQEGTPTVLMEAQSTGLPVISTYHSGIPEAIIDGKSGFLVPEKDIDALVEKLEYLIEHKESWPEMGKRGRKLIEEEYNIKNLVQKLIALYQNVVEQEI